MRHRATIPPAPLVLAAALAGAALVFSGGGSTPARSAASAPISPTPSASPTPTAPAGPPSCARGDLLALAPEYTDWRRTLLDTTYRLPPGYAPSDLSAADSAGLGPNVVVRAFVAKDLGALAAAAEGAGHPLGVVAAYRSFKDQRLLLQQRVQELGKAVATERVAQPGHSEHQLGTALDFTSKDFTDVTAAWGRSPTGKWMSANAWRFGFVLSYPKGKEAVTCYPYEPWHFRYVGRRVAAAVHGSGLTLREYLWQGAESASPTATGSVP